MNKPLTKTTGANPDWKLFGWTNVPEKKKKLYSLFLENQSGKRYKKYKLQRNRWIALFFAY